MCQKLPSATSFDHLVGAGEQRGRHLDAACFGSLEIHRSISPESAPEVGGFLALQDIVAPHTTTASHIDLIERRVGLAVSGLPSCTCGILLHVAVPGPL